jgi:uncharacterized protein
MRLAVLLLVLATACSTAAREGSPEAGPSPTSGLQNSPALIETSKGSVLFNVEIAVTGRDRAHGLMQREQLAPKEGIAFLFFKPTREGFWMKNTLIPLSIAFFDSRGRILKILDMEPCHASPCPVYHPGVRYSGALEVNQGAFEANGVVVGDVIHLAP